MVERHHGVDIAQNARGIAYLAEDRVRYREFVHRVSIHCLRSTVNSMGLSCLVFEI